MGRRHLLPAALLLTTVGFSALAACSQDGGSATDRPSAGGSSSTGSGPATSTASPTGTPTASTSPTPTESSTPAPRLPTDRIEAASLHLAVLGQNAATTPEEQAVVEAWMAFWQGAANSYYRAEPTADFLAAAQGSARTQIVDNIEKLKRADRRVVGWARDNITAVSVDGDTATIRDCTKNFTFSVDAEAEPVTNPPPWYAVTGTLKRTVDGWVVVAQESTEPKQSCL
ncbi:MAG: hypothetical protein WB441_04960 [Nocardioidaceae bacterium]